MEISNYKIFAKVFNYKNNQYSFYTTFICNEITFIILINKLEKGEIKEVHLTNYIFHSKKYPFDGNTFLLGYIKNGKLIVEDADKKLNDNILLLKLMSKDKIIEKFSLLSSLISLNLMDYFFCTHEEEEDL